MICDFPPSRAIVNIYKREKRASEYLRKYLENISQSQYYCAFESVQSSFCIEKENCSFQEKINSISKCESN